MRAMVLPPDELVERARRGDPVAFEQLVRPHLPGLRRLALAFAKQGADADDLAQDALVRAFRSFRQFEGRSALGTWLYSVARSVCHDWYRKQRSLARERLELEDEVPASVGPQDQLLEAKSDVEALWRALKQLDAIFRVPLVLYEVEGMSYEEIATIEHVPVGTIRSRLSRGRQRLTELLNLETSLGNGDDVPPGTEPGRASSHEKVKAI